MSIEFFLAGIVLVLLYGAYFVYSYRKGFSRLGAMKVHRDVNPTWFKIYVACNLMVLGGTTVFLIYAATQSI